MFILKLAKGLIMIHTCVGNWNAELKLVSPVKTIKNVAEDGHQHGDNPAQLIHVRGVVCSWWASFCVASLILYFLCETLLLFGWLQQAHWLTSVCFSRRRLTEKLLTLEVQMQLRVPIQKSFFRRQKHMCDLLMGICQAQIHAAGHGEEMVLVPSC